MVRIGSIQRWSRRLLKYKSKGYLLPTVIMLGFAISTVSIVALKTVAQNSSTLSTHYYNTLAREAAQAGVTAVKTCVLSEGSSWIDTKGVLISNINSLTPQKDCDLSTDGGKAAVVVSNDNYRSSFEVTSVQRYGASATAVMVTSVGKVIFSDSSGSGSDVGSMTETIRAVAKSTTPVTGPVPRPVDRLSTNGSTTCAISEAPDSWVYCWGNNGGNANGMLGTGWNYNGNRSRIAMAVAKGTQSAQVSSTQNPCDNNIFTSAPTCAGATTSAIAADKKIAKISIGTDHVCTIATDSNGANGRAYCWGENGYGQLGTRNTTDANVPKAVDTASTSALYNKTVVDISAGNRFTCAITQDGTNTATRKVACWGRNQHGQLGDDSETDKNYPVSVSYDSAPRQDCIRSEKRWWGGVTCVEYRTLNASALIGKEPASLAEAKDASTMCVLDKNKEAFCWGENFAGQVGGGLSSAPSSSGSGSERHSDDKSCDDTGPNSIRTKALEEALNGMPFVNGDVLRPVAVGAGNKFSKLIISSSNATPGDYIDLVDAGVGEGRDNFNGSVFSVYITAISDATSPSPNRIYYWGGSVNFNGYIECDRNGNYNGSDYAIADASISRSFSGANSPSGPLYNDSSAGPLNGVQLGAVTGNALEGLFCASHFNVATNIACHGHGDVGREGQIGNGQSYPCVNNWPWGLSCPTLPPDPIDISNSGDLTGSITSINTSGNHTCAIADKKIYCWGLNDKGQLGDGTTTNRNAPKEIIFQNTDIEQPIGSGSGVSTWEDLMWF
jgi:hypothetical protein